jgi:beta-N-acetylhexosaminidase
MGTDILGVGLTGKALTELERKILVETTPYAVVLFGRNIDSAGQLRELVREVKSLSKRPPVIMIDEEGGRVDRLRNIVPGLPSAEAFMEGEKPAEMAQGMGRIIGLALRHFDIEIDLAPVVDIRGDEPPKGLERRTFGGDAKTVIDLAGAFVRGLHSAGVAGCLKHFPGIGLGTADPHYGATIIDVPLEELERVDLEPYKALGKQTAAVMIGHGCYPQIDAPDLPATLSRKITTGLLRNDCGFEGVAITDDMEMHAVSDLGSYEEVTTRAVLAGNDVILYCSHIERIPELQAYMRHKADTDAPFAENFFVAKARAAAYRDHCNDLRRTGSPQITDFDELRREADKFCEAFQKTRPTPGSPGCQPFVERRRTPRAGMGRTGREEWT